MIQRSAYVIPMSYLSHPASLGLYDAFPNAIADIIAQAGPLAVSGQILRLAHASQAAIEPSVLYGLIGANI
jgi:hypothetical protein